jgi:D-glycero-D-manno-heptose 1,7-bisphosphate phosphatase
MILRAAKEHALDLGHSILVGDKATDIEAGRRAGIGCCVMVLTGHPVSDEDLEKADKVFMDLKGMAGALAEKQLRGDCNR